MKKTLLVAALAAVMVFAFTASAFAYGPVWSGGTASPTDGFPNYNTYKVTSPEATWDAADGGGYLRWSVAQTYNPANTGSPHSNYTSTTNKCAVCHAVHRADSAGTVLTAWDGSAGGGDMAATGSCVYCHSASATFTNVRVQTGNATTVYALSPHGRCQRCHTPSPHGAGASDYPVLAEKLINTSADIAIETDITSGENDLDPAMFDLTGTATQTAQGVTLGTGYLCTACHDNAADPVVFAVNTTESRPWIAGLDAQSPVTGHRVYAMNTNTWNEAGEYGAYYSGTTDGAGDSTVAFNPATGCKKCHDATTSWGAAAFPHGYVSTGGARSASSETSAALIWMTYAGDADDARSVASSDALGGKAAALTTDGLCLKCHVNGAGDAGVGITY